MWKILRQLLHYLAVDPDVKKVAPAQPNSAFHHGLLRDDNKYATGNAILQSVQIIEENFGQKVYTSVSCSLMSRERLSTFGALSARHNVDGSDYEKLSISISDNKGECDAN